MLERLGVMKARVMAMAARDKVTGFRDEDIVFLMPVYKDAMVAAASLRRLRKIYPRSRVILVSDGDADFPGEAFEKAFGVEYILGENLYGIDKGGALIDRMLSLYLRAPARWLVRLDTDARIDRRFRYLPAISGVHGKVGSQLGNIAGGCILFTDDAVRKLSDSGVFASDELLDPVASWGRFSMPELLERKLRLGTVAYEKVLRWGCERAGVPLVSFAEMFVVWKASPEVEQQLGNSTRRFAVVHPDRMPTEQFLPGGEAA